MLKVSNVLKKIYNVLMHFETFEAYFIISINSVKTANRFSK